MTSIHHSLLFLEFHPDTDGDRLPDGAEVLIYEDDPLNGDTDGDGTPDGDDHDYDEDGVTDGMRSLST